jgi:hypothetical protein
MEGGTVKCWGMNTHGQLGDGSRTERGRPVNVVAPGGPMVAVGAGGLHTCAVLEPVGVQCWGNNAGGQLGDGTTLLSTTPKFVLLDSDKDGCSDGAELITSAGSQATGGLRNPKSFWDFFDTPDSSNERDRIINVSDIGRIVARFGATGDPAADPLSAPPAAGYHTAFDRTTLGPNLWNAGLPNGGITVQDIGLIVAQFGHTCA